MDIVTLLFSFQGRINRAKYWLAAVIYIAVMALMIGLGFATNVSGLFLALAFVVYIVVAVSGVAVGVKRLHDRDKSGWWLLLFYLVPGVLGGLAGTDDVSGGAVVLNVASFAISIWALVELGILRGTTGANRYGPDPLPL